MSRSEHLKIICTMTECEDLHLRTLKRTHVKSVEPEAGAGGGEVNIQSGKQVFITPTLRLLHYLDSRRGCEKPETQSGVILPHSPPH